MSSSLIRWSHSLFFSQTQKTNRVSPVEMIDSYQYIVTELRKNEINVVILQQVVVHPDIDGLWDLSEMTLYRDHLERFAKENQVTIYDPLPHCPQLELCFENQEWYSEEGHRAAYLAIQPFRNAILGK